MRLSRQKKDLTGSLSVDIFFTYMPERPTMIEAAAGRDILVYIGGHIAFTGKMDRRIGSGSKGGGKKSEDAGAEVSSSISADEYTITLTARGKTKYLIDSSHVHKTTNLLKPTSKSAFEEILGPYEIETDWQATPAELDKLRLRDGGNMLDEITRLAAENAHFVYEARDGKLRVTDNTGTETGEDIILGQNILTFSAEQGEEESKSEIKVKGQRTAKEVWGKDALVNTQVKIKDKAVQSFAPLVIQHYGDATPEALKKRAKFEADKRSALSKEVTVEVFHVQARNGDPWDIGTKHYVEIPPEGIFDMMECIKLEYVVDATKTLKTKLTLAPLPSKGTGGATGPGTGLQSFANVEETLRGAAKKAAFNISFGSGDYPSPWEGPQLEETEAETEARVAEELTNELIAKDGLAAAGGASKNPPATLPASYDK